MDLGMPSSGKKAFLWTTENSAMSGSRASQEHEQRPWVDMVDRSGHLYWMIRIPASQHLRRMGATATSVSCVESVSGVGPSHTLRMGSTPSSGYGTQRFAFAKILYDHGHILPVPCPSEDQHADIGTKAPCSATVQQAFPGTPWRNQAFAVTIMLLKGLKAFGIDGFGNDWLKVAYV